MQQNNLGQPVGDIVSMTELNFLPVEQMAGHYCRLELLDLVIHAESLLVSRLQWIKKMTKTHYRLREGIFVTIAKYQVRNIIYE